MKKTYQCLGIIFLWMVFFISPLFAEDMYVKGITKITMRTGPGVENKIVAMLNTGDKLEIVNYKWDWSQVKTDHGKIGWVLSRLLTREVPEVFLIERIKKENLELTAKLEAFEAENKMLAGKNAVLNRIEEKYNTLEQESADFLKLDERYKKIMEQSRIQKEQIKILENNLNTEQKFWFLTGAAVFVFGILLGLTTRKKKRSRLL
ncbi:TIGR04211 family SH3 domain-containing protein [Desulfobacula sp.]